jgi:hypothetical protein
MDVPEVPPQNAGVYEGNISELQGAEIRLLRLYPGAFESQITTELDKETLEQRPKYAALSYNWGRYDAQRDYKIRCNGKEFIVTSNLHAALQRTYSCRAKV